MNQNRWARTGQVDLANRRIGRELNKIEKRINSLADAIAFNNANAATEMPYFFQEIFELAPIVQVPAAGTAFSEPTLIKLASAFEAATRARFPPTFTGNFTTANTQRKSKPRDTG